MVAQNTHLEQVKSYRPLSALVPAHWQSGTIQAEDGTVLHYTRTGGDKPAIVLLHGVQVDGLMWLRTAKALESEYDVIMPDARGHGKSGRVDKGASAKILVNDVATLIEVLGLEKLMVIGHSMGADTAGRVAAAQLSGGVVLVDPALQVFAPASMMTGDEMPPWMQPILEAMQALKTQSHEEKMVTGLRMLPPGTAPFNEDDYVSFVEGQSHFDTGFFRYMTQLGYLFQESEIIAKIDCPALLLTARPMMPGANIDAGVAAFTENWQNGEHIHFEDSGHFIPFDQFNRFIKVLTGFLKRIDS